VKLKNNKDNSNNLCRPWKDWVLVLPSLMAFGCVLPALLLLGALVGFSVKGRTWTGYLERPFWLRCRIL
jgi:hypothetical protein